jgi:enoyl-CoA hydratase/carnithine racemase
MLWAGVWSAPDRWRSDVKLSERLLRDAVDHHRVGPGTTCPTLPGCLRADRVGRDLFIDSMGRMNEARPITIARIRGRARGGDSEFALSCDLRFATLLGRIRLVLTHEDDDLVAAFVADHHAAGLGPWRSTVQAARTFCGRVARAGGWVGMGLDAQIDATRRAVRFVSWLLVTGRLVGSSDLLTGCDLRLGVAAARYRPSARAWFAEIAQRLDVNQTDVELQWATLAKVIAVTGVLAERIGTLEFEHAQTALVTAFAARGLPASGRNLTAALFRLRLRSIGVLAYAAEIELLVAIRALLQIAPPMVILTFVDGVKVEREDQRSAA